MAVVGGGTLNTALSIRYRWFADYRLKSGCRIEAGMITHNVSRILSHDHVYVTRRLLFVAYTEQ